MQDFARIWQSADKIVYSRTLERITTSRTRIERDFDPEAVRRLKLAATHDLTVGGAELAARAIETGLVDEYQLFVVPVLVGGGKRALPDNAGRITLELLEERRFRNGTVYLHCQSFIGRPSRIGWIQASSALVAILVVGRCRPEQAGVYIARRSRRAGCGHTVGTAVRRSVAVGTGRTTYSTAEAEEDDVDGHVPDEDVPQAEVTDRVDDSDDERKHEEQRRQ